MSRRKRSSTKKFSFDCHVSTHEQGEMDTSVIYTNTFIETLREEEIIFDYDEEEKTKSNILVIRYDVQRKMQLDFDVFAVLGDKTLRTASSKTCLRPFCVNAEHSTYLKARIFLHNR